MSHYKPYPAYKDSGIEWIGKVPEHWNVVPIKRVAMLKRQRTNDSPDGVDYIGLEDVEPESGKYSPTEGNSRQSEGSTVSNFSTGDVLYGKLRPYLRKAIVADRDGVCSTEFLVLEANQVASDLLQKWLLTSEVTQQIESGCDGAKMPRADWEGIGGVHIPVPPTDEQKSLVQAIKTETDCIDTLIAKKTRFIELLKEKRQTLITHLIIKGLNPDVTMKSSGIEWIGQIPEGWNVVRFKHLLSESMKYGANESAESDDKDYPRYIRITDLTESGELREDTFKSLPWEKANNYLLSDGDILLARSGATVGKSFLYSDEHGRACYAGYLINARCDKQKVTPNYIYAFLQSHSYWEYIGGNNIKATIENVSAERYGNLPIPVPNLEVQDSILKVLQHETTHIDTIIAKTQQSIELLKERRSAFITAAVTGQIDLQGESK